MRWVASQKYRLISGDIKTAFLSGDEDVRNIFIAPPDDVRKMLNVDHETVLRLRKAVYGQTWWDRLRKSLIQHGFTIVGVGLWIITVHSYHFSWQNCAENDHPRQCKIYCGSTR